MSRASVRRVITFCIIYIAEAASSSAMVSQSETLHSDTKSLPEPEFRAIIAIAVQWLKRYPYPQTIYKVHLLTGREVSVYVRDQTKKANTHWLLLERLGSPPDPHAPPYGGWHVTKDYVN
jgi:hypothetical protein